MNPYERKTWNEFDNAGLFWFINRIILVLGWTLVFEMDDNRDIINVWPAKVKKLDLHYDNYEEIGFRDVRQTMREVDTI